VWWPGKGSLTTTAQSSPPLTASCNSTMKRSMPMRPPWETRGRYIAPLLGRAPASAHNVSQIAGRSATRACGVGSIRTYDRAGIASALRAHAACGAGHLRPARIEAGPIMSSGSPHAPALDHDGGYFSPIHLCRHDAVTASALDKSVHIEAAVSIDRKRQCRFTVPPYARSP